jgi:hypothetical protein
MNCTIKKIYTLKVIFSLVIIGLFFNSCKKNNSGQTAPASKLYTVAFHLDQFTQTFSTFQVGSKGTSSITKTASVRASSSVPLTSLIDVLYCYVYDSTGKFLISTKQDSTLATFGQVSLNLAAGNYKVVFAGGKSNLNYTSTGNISTDQLTHSGVLTDTFFKEMDITVSAANSEQGVTMDRIVGLVEINVEDQIPSNVNYFLVRIASDFSNFSVGTQTPNTTASKDYNSKTLTTATRAPNFKMSFLMLNTTTPFRLEVLGWHTEGDLSALEDIFINNVTATDNSTTIVTGSLFGGGSDVSGGFNIVVDPGWAATPITQSF